MYRIISLLVLAVLLSGCAATAYQRGDVTYHSDGFDSDALRDGGLAILPVVAGQGVEGFRRPFGDAVNSLVDERSQDMDVMTWQETMERINSGDLARTYNNAVVTYRETSIIDRALVRDLGAATGLRYLLFLQLDPPRNESELRGGVLASGLYEYETIGVSAHAQVWDAATGDVVWEGYGEAGVTETNEYVVIKDSDRDPNTHSGKVAEEIVQRLFE